MNLKQVKSKLAELDKSSSNKSGEVKKNVFFKPVIGKQTVRVVPNKYDPDGQFQQIKVYYGITNKVMASPANWGEKDPIAEFIKQLRNSNDKENWKLSKKLEAKTRVFTPVVVRGEEDPEVKLWSFGVMTYQDFLNLADDAEIGDYTDVSEGRDIKLTTIGPDQTGTDYAKTTISPSLTATPLSKDPKMVKFLLENQPDPLDTFKRYSYEEVKDALRTYLNPDDNGIGDDEDEAVTAEMPKVSDVKRDMAKIKPKAKATDKFDAIFEEEQD